MDIVSVIALCVTPTGMTHTDLALCIALCMTHTGMTHIDLALQLYSSILLKKYKKFDVKDMFWI